MPGSYGFSDALKYRLQTTVPYVQATSELMELERRYVPFIRPGSMGIQYIDDATDSLKDMRSNAANLVVGMAKSLGELDELQKLCTQNASSRQALLAVPRTRHLYRLAFQKELSAFGLPVHRRVLSAFGRAVM